MPSFFKKYFQTASDKNPRPALPAAGQDKIRISTCVIMLEVAGSDNEFTADEKAIIVDALGREFVLDKDDVNDLMEQARRKADESVDTWGFTNTLKQSLSEEERIRILESIWRIIYSDNHLSQHEDSLVHKLSYLLGLTHSQLIAAKLKVRPL